MSRLLSVESVNNEAECEARSRWNKQRQFDFVPQQQKLFCKSGEIIQEKADPTMWAIIFIRLRFCTFRRKVWNRVNSFAVNVHSRLPIYLVPPRMTNSLRCIQCHTLNAWINKQVQRKTDIHNHLSSEDEWCLAVPRIVFIKCLSTHRLCWWALTCIISCRACFVCARPRLISQTNFSLTEHFSNLTFGELWV